jgi:ATP-dependent Clp protease ATP-binding subunit ClpX
MECSFCGKSEEQVDRLIVGLIGVAICGECVYLCVRVLQGDDDANQGADRIVRDAIEGD